jgi:hypothetical protein
MAKVIDEWVARSGADPGGLRYVRLRGRNAWVAVLLDSRNAEPLKMLVAERI